MNKTICPVCKKRNLVIDEWNGWIWACFFCGYEGDYATKEEVGELEQWQKTEIALRDLDNKGVVL